MIARPFPGIITEEKIISMTEMQSNQQSRFHDPCKTPPLQGNYKISGNPKIQSTRSLTTTKLSQVPNPIAFFSIPGHGFQALVQKFQVKSKLYDIMWTSSAYFTSHWVCFISNMPKDCNQLIGKQSSVFPSYCIPCNSFRNLSYLNEALWLYSANM